MSICDLLQPGCGHPVEKSSVLWSYQCTGLQILADTIHASILLLGKVSWEQCPGNLSFIISIGNSLNPCSAVSSGAFTHTFAFVAHLYRSFLSITKLYKLVLLFLLLFCAGVLRFHLQFFTVFISREILLFSFSVCLQNILQKYFFFHYFSPKCQY